MAVRAVLEAATRHLRRSLGSLSVNSPEGGRTSAGGFLCSSSMRWVQFSSLHIDIPKDLPKPAITVSDEPDTLYKRVSILVKGHDKSVLDSYEYFAVLAAEELGLTVKVHEPPRKIERFTLLKSVHIFKKHRVQYEMRTLYRCLELEHLTGCTAGVYLEYIQRNLPEGVAMEVTKTELQPLPEHIKEPFWHAAPAEKEESRRVSAGPGLNQGPAGFLKGPSIIQLHGGSDHPCCPSCALWLVPPEQWAQALDEQLMPG
ncbi:small ribosomal subunit protein uS10m [Ctenodactylus gundi]